MLKTVTPILKNWTQYHKTPLEGYVENFYGLLRENFEILPSRIQKMMPYMIRDNWLLSYQSVEGIARILSQMNRRTQGKSKMDLAIVELETYYEEFEKEFTAFFAELLEFSNQKLKEL